jgi:hypothetical protein
MIYNNLIKSTEHSADADNEPKEKKDPKERKNSKERNGSKGKDDPEARN